MKTFKIASIVTGIVLAAGMGVASAAPMQLTGTQMDDVTGGSHGYYSGYYCGRCAGSSADASASANSYGHYNSSSAHTYTFSAPGSSSAGSMSSSCTNAGC